MVEYVIEELKNEKEVLSINWRSIDNTIKSIEYKGQIKINANDYSNGTYLTNIEFGFDDILNSLKEIRSRHEKQIVYIDNILDGLEEEAK